MACNNLGLWAFSSNPVGLCDAIPSVPVYGDSINIGEFVFSGAPCNTTPPTDYLEPGFYSNNTIIFETTTSTGPVSIVSISACPINEEYCIQNTESFNQTYVESGTYNGFNYFTGQSYSSFIFYSTGETRWCLSVILDGPCDQFGPYNSTSLTPDFDDTVMYSGACVTTTTTTSACENFDFEAIFDCLVTPTPSLTPSPSQTPTPTPTPTVSNICGGVSMSVSVTGITPTPSPTQTPTPSPSPEVTRPCSFSGEVIFNSFSEVLQCANSKLFKDCFTGIDYYTSDIVLDPLGNTPKEGYVYKMNINGQSHCAIYQGLFENISGVDIIELITEIGPVTEGSCLNCDPGISPTPSPTPTPTPTPTPSPSPCVSLEYRVTNIGPSSLKYSYTNCLGNTISANLTADTNFIVCSTTIPISPSLSFTAINLQNVC